MYQLPLLNKIPAVRHGFFTRANGISQGVYRGCNCGLGSKDSPRAIEENRARIATAMSVEKDQLITLCQIHSTDIITLNHRLPPLLPEGDGLVTTTPKLALGILTADCVPVLFADNRGGIIGAAHAGWKGALGGILNNTITAMEKQGANRSHIHAAIGPCISQSSYQVGAEFPQAFLQQDKNNQDFFIPSPAKPDHWQFNIGGYVARQLEQLNIGDYGLIHQDTYGNEDEFFSYRRSYLKEEVDYGRHISVIALTS